jgi:hypothetical protein
MNRFFPVGEIGKNVEGFFSFSQSIINIKDKDPFVKKYD